MTDELKIELIGEGPPVQSRWRVLEPPTGAVWADGQPAPGQPLVFIAAEVAAAIFAHAASNTRLELGGLLVGLGGVTAEGVPIAVIEAAIPVTSDDSSPTHFRFQGAGQKAAYDELDRSHPGRMVVGWYHTHPHMSVFLSGTDRESHAALWGQVPFGTALVLEPVSNDAGFFGWTQNAGLSRLRSYGVFSLSGQEPTLPWPATDVRMATPGRRPAAPRQAVQPQPTRPPARRPRWIDEFRIGGAMLLAALTGVVAGALIVGLATKDDGVKTKDVDQIVATRVAEGLAALRPTTTPVPSATATPTAAPATPSGTPATSNLLGSPPKCPPGQGVPASSTPSVTPTVGPLQARAIHRNMPNCQAVLDAAWGLGAALGLEQVRFSEPSDFEYLAASKRDDDEAVLIVVRAQKVAPFELAVWSRNVPRSQAPYYFDTRHCEWVASNEAPATRFATYATSSPLAFLFDTTPNC